MLSLLSGLPVLKPAPGLAGGGNAFRRDLSSQECHGLEIVQLTDPVRTFGLGIGQMG